MPLTLAFRAMQLIRAIRGFSFMIALGVITGYVSLGFNYLILKIRGITQKQIRRYSYLFSSLTILLSMCVFLGINLRYTQAAMKWQSVPEVFQMIALILPRIIGFVMLFRSLKKHQEAALLY